MIEFIKESMTDISVLKDGKRIGFIFLYPVTFERCVGIDLTIEDLEEIIRKIGELK